MQKSLSILVFGATGGTGRAVVDQALEAGHHVTAFVRTPSKLDRKHDRLKVLQGDATDNAAVRSAMPGHDAVFCALGAPARDRSGLRERGTAAILEAMEATGVRRLVCLSTYGIAETRDSLPFFLKYVVVPFYLARAFADHEAQEERVRASAVDWTLVRPTNLTDGPLTGDYRHGFPPTESGLKLKISRSDVAHFMLQQLDDRSYLRAAAGVSR